MIDVTIRAQIFVLVEFSDEIGLCTASILKGVDREIRPPGRSSSSMETLPLLDITINF